MPKEEAFSLKLNDCDMFVTGVHVPATNQIT